MIYTRQVVEGERGQGSHLAELESNVFNQTNNIHPQYNNFRGDYRGLMFFDRMLHNIPLLSCGISLPFKILEDETVTVRYVSRITSGTPSNFRHGVEIVSKGVVLASEEEIPTSSSLTNIFDLSIVGKHTDGYIRIYKRGISSSFIPYNVDIYNLIIT